MFKGLKHMFKALKLLSTALGQMFKGCEWKIPLGVKKKYQGARKNFPSQKKNSIIYLLSILCLKKHTFCQISGHKDTISGFNSWTIVLLRIFFAQNLHYLGKIT